MFVYVRKCSYMFVYVRKCSYMFVYVRICSCVFSAILNDEICDLELQKQNLSDKPSFVYVRKCSYMFVTVRMKFQQFQTMNM